MGLFPKLCQTSGLALLRPNNNSIKYFTEPKLLLMTNKPINNQFSTHKQSFTQGVVLKTRIMRNLILKFFSAVIRIS